MKINVFFVNDYCKAWSAQSSRVIWFLMIASKHGNIPNLSKCCLKDLKQKNI